MFGTKVNWAKKFLAIVIVMMFFIPVFPVNAAIGFKIDPDGTIVGYDGEIPTTLTIPSEIDGITVTSIGDRAFYSSGITDLTLPANITVGESSFQNNSITSLELNNVSTGLNSFADNSITELSIVNTENIGVGAFRDNAISLLSLDDALVSIGDNAFSSNKLIDVNIPINIKNIGNEAFSANEISKIIIPDSIESFGNEVFNGVNKWVEIETNSDVVTTSSYADGFGHIVNPVVVTFDFIDSNSGEKIKESVVVGNDFNSDDLYSLGVEGTYAVPSIGGYTADQDVINFIPDNRDFNVVVSYTKDERKPVIRASGKSFDANAVIDETALLEGVVATGVNGENLTSLVTVSPKTIDSSVSGTHDVYYTVTDSAGRSATSKVVVTVGIDFSEVEVGGGLKVGHFVYNGNRIIGMTDEGLQVLAGNGGQIFFPEFNNDGIPVTVLEQNPNQPSGFIPPGSATSVESWGGLTGLGTRSLSSVGLQSIPDSWGNITTIGFAALAGNDLENIPDDWGNVNKLVNEAFTNNKITSIPNSWGDITILPPRVFENNQLISIPDSWEGIKEIQGRAFNKNNLETIPADWGDITTIGDSAFRDNKIKVLPSSWGDVKTIQNYVFTNNQITSLPDSWGNITVIPDFAFEKNLIEEIPNWDGITKIGVASFRTNKLTYLPEFWSTVEIVGGHAFTGNNIVAIPEDWENVHTIGASAFAGNSIEDIPDSWGKVENIQNNAFSKNKIKEIPDDWGLITKIEARTFADNQIIRIPDDWKNITNIGESAFQNNQLTTLPDDWGLLTKIEARTFSNNQIIRIPDDWGDITTIGSDAFPHNQLTSLPDDWGNITTIGNYAFHNNQLTTIPDNWGLITYLGGDAFGRNKITNLPENWGNITKIGNNPFSSSNFKHLVDQSFYIPSENLTEEMAKSLENIVSNNFQNAGPMILFTDDGTNPNNIPSTNKLIINPNTTTFTFVDKDGKELSTPVIITDYELGNFENGVYTPPAPGTTYEPPFINGYITPEPATVIPENGQDPIKTHTFVYEKLDDEDLEKQIIAALDLETVKSNPIHTIGDSMNALVKIDLSGFNTDSITNSKVYIKYNPEYFDNWVNVTGGQEFPFINKAGVKIIPELGVIEIPLNQINAGDSIEIPLQMKFKKKETPRETEIYIEATLIQDGKQISKTDTDYFIGKYRDPSLVVTIDGERTRKVILSHDREGNISTAPTGYVTGNSTIEYKLSPTSIERNIDSYKLIVELPEYKVHEEAPTYDPKNEGTRRAVFDASKNEGWVLNDDGITLTYEGNANNTTTIKPVILQLDYPEASEDITSVLESRMELTPNNMSPNETILIAKDNISHLFTGREGLVKGPEKEWFWDTQYGREEVKNWLINVLADGKNYENLVIREHDLDERLAFASVEAPKNILPAVLTMQNELGEDIISTELTETASSYIIPFNIREQIKSFEIAPRGKVNENGTIIVGTVLKDPSVPQYDETPLSEKNVYWNFATISADNLETMTSKERIAVQDSKQELGAFKLSSGSGDFITGGELTYTVGFDPSVGSGNDLWDIEIVDLIPSGVEITDYKMSDKFSRLEGAKVEYTENYNNTGNPAIIWTADKVSYKDYKPGSRFIAGTIDAYIRIDREAGTMANDLFITVDNNLEAGDRTQLRYKADDSRLPAKENGWSKAERVVNVTPASAMIQKKSVREVGGDGLWKNNISTKGGANIEYKLEIINATDNERKNPVIYDVLPAKGDLGLPSNPENSPLRESTFSNNLDTTKEIKVPDGFIVEYTTDDIPEYDINNSESVLSQLKWTTTASSDTTAIRITSPDGYILEPRTTLSIIVPMTVPNDRNTIGQITDELANGIAWNSFFYKDDIQPRLIEGNRVSNTINKDPINIEFVKNGYDHNGIKPLQGAEFELLNPEGNLIATAKSDENGIVKFSNLIVPENSYIKETKTVDGYVLNEQTILLDKEKLSQGFDIKLSPFINWAKMTPIEPVMGEVLFKKVDINGNPLGNIEFELSRSFEWVDNLGKTHQETRQYTAKSSPDGTVKFANIDLGTYTLTEKNPINHLQAIEPKEVVVSNSVNADTKVSVDLGNIVNDKVGLKVTKLGITDDKLGKEFGTYQRMDGATLPNVVLNFVPQNCDTQDCVPVKVTTDANGEAIVGNIVPNVVYTIDEPELPEGYTSIKDKDLSFMVNEKGRIVSADGDEFSVQSSLFIPNLKEKQTSTININKEFGINEQFGADYIPEDGALFGLEKLNSETNEWTLIDQVTTGADGIATFDNVEHGIVRVSELSAADGWSRTFDTKTFTVEPYNSKTFTWRAYNKPINLDLIKAEPLTTVNSELAAKGFVETSEECKAEGATCKIVKDGSTYKVGLLLKDYQLELFEVDAENNPVGDPIMIVNDEGKTILKPLNEKGKYAIVETKTPEGYRGLVKPMIVDMSFFTKNSPLNGKIEKLVPNYKNTGSVIVSKYDKNLGIAIPNTKFSLTPIKHGEGETSFEADGANWITNGETKELITSGSGFASFTKLEFGYYAVQEVEAAENYVLDDTIHVVQVNKETPNISLSLYNQMITQDISIVKKGFGCDVNVDSCELVGAEFELYKVNPSVEGATPIENTPTVREDNKAWFDASLTPGDYWLLETKSPNGHELLTSPVEFTLTPEGTVILKNNSNDLANVTNNNIIEVHDITTPDLPIVGGNGMFNLAWMGTIIISLVITFLLVPRRREHETIAIK